ncbi:hypothetical protein D9X91_15075 [Falsibacillus albus]|uniref:Uncharacterized protein n=1 Tax=Falsibacillus albus TaxID=2478915 RepID=A0A3L7JWC0_9BACI|nr:hypothetical protein D9X91_15075 [Falsibacillus albus]
MEQRCEPPAGLVGQENSKHPALRKKTASKMKTCKNNKKTDKMEGIIIKHKHCLKKAHINWIIKRHCPKGE